MTTAVPDYAALLGSRICHDLISPLGAIGNGVELLQMSGMDDSPEMSLITESVENANARVRFFRVAFGAAQPGQSIAATECRSVLGPVGRARGLSIHWRIDEDVPRDEARLAFLLLQCCETALPWGGEVRIDHDAARWTITAMAKRIKPEPELWRRLTDPVDATDAPAPSEIHFPLARMAADGLERRIAVDVAETSLRLGF